MRLTEKQRELLTELVVGLPGLLSVWNEASDEEPPKSDERQLFTTIRRLPCDMKPEDGSLRYANPPPFPGATPNRVSYFYEPAQPAGLPTLLVVIAWSCPGDTVAQAIASVSAPTSGDA